MGKSDVQIESDAESVTTAPTVFGLWLLWRLLLLANPSVPEAAPKVALNSSSSLLLVLPVEKPPNVPANDMASPACHHSCCSSTHCRRVLYAHEMKK
jgi:hypothetical protein